MKIKVELSQLHFQSLPWLSLSGLSFPDGDTLPLSTPLADFLMHLEVLGMNLDNGFTIQTEEIQ